MVAALVVVLVSGVLGGVLWSADLVAFAIVATGGFLVFATIGVVLLVVRDTRWLGVGLLVGSGVVAAIELALVLVAEVGP